MIKAFRVAALTLTLWMTASCEKILEPEGDCSSNWYVQFVYTKNPQATTSLTGVGADAFAQSVRSVHLYIYDAATGNYVTDYEAAGEELGSGSWRLPIDLKPGEYDLVAWCHGSADLSKAYEAFDTRAAVDRESLGWRVRRDAYGLPWNDEAWNPANALFYGEKMGSIITNEVGDHTIVVELTKDTNHINVTVQFTTDTYAPDEFYVVWCEDSGTLDAHNNPVAGDELVYKPYDEFFMDDDYLYGDEVINAGTKYSKFGVSRLMAEHANDAYLEVRDASDGTVIYGVNLIGLICNLLHEDRSNPDYDQYYLDCQDTYNCHFILSPDNGGRWLASRININNWTVVPQQNVGGLGE